MTGFIGGGNMAEALIRGMVSRGMRDILVSDPKEERRRELERKYGVKATSSNVDVVSASSIIVLAVKPQNMDEVVLEIGGSPAEGKTFVSIAAGVTLSYLEAGLKTKSLIRVMPNTPALVGEGMSVLALCGCSYGPELETVKGIFMSVGRVLVLPEKNMNAVTALSGSGPGFIALFVEAMIEAGEKMGIAQRDASELAVQTLLGTAKLLDTGMAPEKLREMVTSPGGTTAAGLKVFEERGFIGVVEDALKAARDRAEELGRRK